MNKTDVTIASIMQSLPRVRDVEFVIGYWSGQLTTIHFKTGSPFSSQICVLWTSQPYPSVHKYVYFGHLNLTFQCTNMCTLATSTLPFSAQICVLWPSQPYLSVHKYVYFGHLNLTFQCTNMCTLATSTLPFSAQICVLRPPQPYLSVHKCVLWLPQP
jgi:hypothetical protein